MAGIAGLILKQHAESVALNQAMCDNIIASLRFSAEQTVQQWSNNTVFCCGVSQIGYHSDDQNHLNSGSDTICVVEGLVYFNDSISSDEQTNNTSSKIASLYEAFEDDFIHHISGNYNIFIYNLKIKKAILVNNKLGFLPLYIYENSKYFIFASKIEAILASGVMNDIAFDYTTMIEHLHFNYAISDNTFIKDIWLMPPATMFKINDTVQQINYWNCHELMNLEPISDNTDSQVISQSLKEATTNIFENREKVFVSLTGGWDSRVVLSCLLPKYRDQICIYSFGAEKSPDITIPQTISKKEKLNYLPFILDNEYLENRFISNAQDTVRLSNGTRTYKRTHYLYAMKAIGNHTNTVLTGIFGDEVFKVGKPQGGGVISNRIIGLLESGFNPKIATLTLKNHGITSDEELIREFSNRIERIKSQFSIYSTLSQKYFAFRLMVNLRKYFGAEVNSYNDFVNCHSPFLDIKFLEQYSRTKFAAFKYPFETNSIKQKKQTTKLYTDIVSFNYKPLTYYDTARGYSMHDSTTILGQIKIFYAKFFRNTQAHLDAYNSASLDLLVKKNWFDPTNENNLIETNRVTFNNNDPNALSLLIWMNTIHKKYMR